MIEKMKFISVIGPKDQLDTVTRQYLCRYEIQLENAMGELKHLNNITPNAELNPYREAAGRAAEIAALYGSKGTAVRDMDVDTAMERITEVQNRIQKADRETDALEKELKKERGLLDAVSPYQELHFDISRILHFKEVRFRFGRLPVGYYERLKTYAYDDACTIFEKCKETEDYVWGVYFVPAAEAKKVDAIYASLHFERIHLEDAYEGTVDEACRELKEKTDALEQQITAVRAELAKELNGMSESISAASKTLAYESKLFDVRKLAARIEEGDNKEDYYILCGWMGEDDVNKFLAESKNDDKVFVVVEEDKEKFFGEPPTKLKNPRFFKPFEMFIRMYGLPANDEMDPTMFVALTYTFIFGAMFGDVGQGLCLFVFGGLLYLIKKINLAGIISIAGLFSTFFGFMFGSIFGFEDVIQAHWLRPVDAMTNLPFIGQLNTVFVVAIAFGMGLNILVMIFNVINSIKSHDVENMLFSHNGIAGLVFYGFLVLTIVLYMTGHKVPGNILMVIFLGVPVILFVFKEPLGNLVTKQHKKMEEGKVMFFVQAFFELFETMLSYFSNTISYVRIGAFAVSHAAMMEVVLMLSGASAGHTNWIVFVLGNVLVCGLEGLVVGIQVLRLEYYEMFSRFYKGTGREFKPFHSQSDEK